MSNDTKPTTFAEELAAAKAEAFAAPPTDSKAAEVHADPKVDGPVPGAEEKPESPKPSDTEASSSSADTAAPATETPEKSAEQSPPVDAKTRERLSLLAREQRRFDKERKAWEEKAAAVRPDLERLEKIRGAKTPLERVRLALDDNDEALAELFLELNEHHASGGAPAKPKEKPVEELVREAVEAIDRKRNDEAATARRAAQERHEAAYVANTLKLLEAKAGDYPLAYVGGVEGTAILSTVREVFEATGEVPSPEMVLEGIEKLRRERQTKISGRKPETKPAQAAAAAGTDGADKQTPSSTWRADAPVNPSRKMSWLEELEEAKREAGLR